MHLLSFCIWDKQVVGDGHGFTQSGGVVFGTSNQLNASGASVLGGIGNTASGLYSAISGGNGNIALGFASAILGGLSQFEYGKYLEILVSIHIYIYICNISTVIFEPSMHDIRVNNHRYLFHLSHDRR